jgi:uncharacterized protein YegJ (DUF2314 family)
MTLASRRGSISGMRAAGHRTWLVAFAWCAAAGAPAGCKRFTTDTRSEPGRAVRDAGPAVTPGQPVPAGGLRAKEFSFTLAVYYLPLPKTDPKAALARLLRGRPIALRPGPVEGPRPEPVTWMVNKPSEEYPPPDEDMMEYASKGLTDAQARALRKSRSVTVMSFAGPGERAAATYHQALQVTGELAAATGGLAWDDETRQVFSREAWEARVDDWHEGLPDITKHMLIHSYRDGELMRLVTLGMGKFALPDLAVNQVASSNVVGNVLNLACQTILERPALARAGELTLAIDEVKHPGARSWATENILDGAKRRAVVQLAVGEQQEGDAQNPLVEIVFPGPAAELQVRQTALIDRLWGSKDAIAYVDHDDELLAASRRAKAALMKHKPRYLKELPEGERLLVKAPFRTRTGGNEWMWVEVVRWRGRTIRGILQNDPFEVPDLKAGARVEVKEDSLFDYILEKKDGTKEGNETRRLLERQEH